MKNITRLLQRLNSKKSIQTILTLVLFISGYGLYAQTPKVAWAKQIGGTGSDYGMGVTVDNAGNIYTTGSFIGTVDFDPDSGTYNLTSTAGVEGDIYINKLDPQGHLIWAKQFKGSATSNSNIGMAIATDSKNNVYVTGSFTGTVDFDPGQDTFSLTGTGGINGFLAKLSPNGDLLWVKRMGGNTVYSHCDPMSIALNSKGDVVISGRFYQTINFNPDGTADNQSSGNNFANIFIAKFTQDGTFSWVKNIGGSGDEVPNSITLDAADNIYATGTFGAFGNTVDFDPGSGISDLTSLGNVDDVFILKLNKDGNFVWAKQLGGYAEDAGNCVATDHQGHLYIAGQFASHSMALDPNQNTDIVNAKFMDVFLVKLDTAGNFIYGKRFGGAGVENVNAVDIDSSGNLFMAGTFTDTTDFSTGNGGGVLISDGLEDGYLTKFSPSGDLQWIKQISGPGIQQPYSIALSSTDNIYTVGTFLDSANFNANGGTLALSSNGDKDIFIEKMAQCLPTDAVAAGNITYTEQNDDSVRFSVNGLSNVSYYYWNFGDGTTSEASNPAHIFPHSGTYTITLIVSNDCNADTVTENIYYTATGIKKVTLNNGILKIYPNPAKGSLFLQVETQQPIETLSVYNILGQRIAVYKNINNSNYTLDTHFLPSGSYTIRLSLKNNKVVYGRFQKAD